MMLSQLIALVGSDIKTKKCKFAQKAMRFISENRKEDSNLKRSREEEQESKTEITVLRC